MWFWSIWIQKIKQFFLQRFNFVRTRFQSMLYYSLNISFCLPVWTLVISCSLDIICTKLSDKAWKLLWYKQGSIIWDYLDWYTILRKPFGKTCFCNSKYYTVLWYQLLTIYVKYQPLLGTDYPYAQNNQYLFNSLDWLVSSMVVVMIYLVHLQRFCNLCMSWQFFQFHDRCLETICGFYLVISFVKYQDDSHATF